jgi:SAM-dependent methyltransferase
VGKGKSKKTIFVLMPLRSDLANTFYAVEQAALGIGAHVEKADRPATTEAIIQRIYNGIEKADLVLADLTDKNPNVFYEIGYAHASGKPVAFLASKAEDVPFNLRNYPILTYSMESPVPELVRMFRDHLAAALQTATDTSSVRVPIARALKHLTVAKESGHLFESLLATKASTVAAEAEQWASGTIRVGPQETREKGVAVLDNLAQGGFATFFVPAERYWLTGTDYLEAARRACRHGKRITRVYLLFDRGGLTSQNLADCIGKDIDSGIEALVCFADDITDREAVRDFGIWDDEMLCLVEVADTSTVTGCTFTVDPVQLAWARRWKENILAVAQPAQQILAAQERDGPRRQPLVTSAPVMAEFAEENCGGSYVDRADCRWYHQAWQYLRLVNLVSTPDWHADFYKESIVDASRDMHPKRVLVCGTADYCILAHLAAALPSGNVDDFEVVVLDVCAAPLKICEWFGRHHGFKLRTLQGDALSLDFRDGWFGLILTDAFLTRFSPQYRPRVVAEWERVLGPGGSVVTTVRLDGGAGGEAVRATESEVKSFVAKARAAAHKEYQRLPCTVGRVEEMARQYAEKMTSYPMTEPELRALFTSFEARVERAETPGEFKSTIYCRVVAKKLA